MSLFRASLVFMLVGAGLTRGSWAAPEPENAATSYRKAFALVPQAPADLEVYKDWTTVPLDARALDVFQRGRQARQILHHASQLHTCDWEWDYSQGLKLQLPELRSVRPIASAAPLWARVCFEQNHAAEGLDVVNDLLVLSRRFGTERMVIARLMARPIETSAWMAASPYLPNMPAEQLHGLADIVARLAALPTVGNSIRSETSLITNEVIDASKPNAPPDSALGDVPREPQQAAELARTIQELNREAARIAELPPDQADQQEPAFEGRLAAAPPLAAHVVVKSPNRLAHAEARAREMWAMFVVAIHVAAKGESALATSKDPLTGAPFRYEKLPGGFRLISGLKENGEAVSFVAGPEALK